MLYGILFLSLTALCVYYGVFSERYWLFWPAVTCFLMAIGYLWLGAKVLGKRPDGSIRWYAFLVGLPYFLYCWSKWIIMRLFIREESCNRLLPDFYIARFALPSQIPVDVRCIVDLTAEFPELAKSRKGRSYTNIPILDGMAPTKKQFISLLGILQTVERPVYLHCAEGHGRSGTIAAGFLILIGKAKNVEEALAALRRIRPRIHLESCQRTFLDKVLPEIQQLS